MAAQHHPQCVDFRDMDPGFAENRGQDFIAGYNDRFNNFPIDTYRNCLGCCLAYLTKDRGYRRLDTEPGLFYVHFPVGDHVRDRIPSVTCFAQKPEGGGVNGQIATGHDLNLGVPHRRPFQASRTYQLYIPQNHAAGGLSIGFPCQARMESVAIDVVNQNNNEISDIKLNFADAMLVERYKERSPEGSPARESFRGYCMTPAPTRDQPLDTAMQSLAVK